jgi:predicted GTPase
MSIDRQLLQQLSTPSFPESKGISGLVRSIHRDPSLREWVTIESDAIAPIPIYRDGEWRILCLLAVPIKLTDRMNGWMAPWGAVEWSWLKQQVTQRLDLRKLPQTAALRQSKPQIDGSTCSLTQRQRIQKEEVLFQELEQFLERGGDSAQLPILLPHYKDLLSPDLCAYYWTLAPECQEWLNFNPIRMASSATDSSSCDFAEQIQNWFDRCLSLANNFAIAEFKTELQTLKARQQFPGFRLAFVGEFSRGKSTLINRLLEQSLLPVGAAPTTATMTSLLPGAENRMEVFSQGKKEVRELQASSWADLLAIDTLEPNQPELPHVRLTLDHSWLCEQDLEIVDTPGAGDLNRDRSEAVFELLNRCDAAVLVISATSPLSMTERFFLEREVIGRHVPQTLVVVTQLDCIAGAERSRIFEFVRSRISEISPAIPVLPASALDDSTTDVEVLASTRHHIAKIATRNDRRFWRNRQILAQLIDQLSHVIEICETAITATQLNEVEREEAIEKEKLLQRNAQLTWEDLRLELESKRLYCNQQLKQKIQNAKDELWEVLELESSKVPDPKFWWERDLPIRLRRELVALSRKSEDFLTKAIAQDFDWFQKEVSHRFGSQLRRKSSQFQDYSVQPLNLPKADLEDIKQYRLMTRIGTGVGMLASVILQFPIGMMISGVGLVSEPILGNKLDHQRKAVRQLLKQFLEQSVDAYCEEVSDRLTKLYHQLIQDSQREQIVWQTSRIRAIQNFYHKQNDSDTWQREIEEALTLKQEIASALQRLEP